MVFDADLLDGRVQYANPRRVEELYPITEEGEYMSRGEIRREAIDAFRTDVENLGLLVISSCEVCFLPQTRLVSVSAIVGDPLVPAGWNALQRRRERVVEKVEE